MLTLTTLILLTTTVSYSESLNHEVKGKWSVDVAATQKLPENKDFIAAKLKVMSKKEFLEVWVPSLRGTTIEFSEKGYHLQMVVEGEVWVNDKPEVEKVGGARIDYKESMGRKPVLFKKSEAYLLNLGERAETLVLKRAK